MKCKKNCCELFQSEYKPRHNQSEHNKTKYDKNKAGVILYDKKLNKILLVQSRGNLWGFPKGTFNDGEDFETCAQRELKEETGIDIDKDKLIRKCYINSKVIYFYLEVNLNDYNIEIQTQEGNDANSIGWINLNCLVDMTINNIIKLNYQAKKAIRKSFNIIIN